jgi:hypothetical protein
LQIYIWNSSQTELRKAQTLAGDLRKDAQIKKQIADRKQK